MGALSDDDDFPDDNEDGAPAEHEKNDSDKPDSEDDCDGPKGSKGGKGGGNKKRSGGKGSPKGDKQKIVRSGRKAAGGCLEAGKQRHKVKAGKQFCLDHNKMEPIENFTQGAGQCKEVRKALQNIRAVAINKGEGAWWAEVQDDWTKLVSI